MHIAGPFLLRSLNNVTAGWRQSTRCNNAIGSCQKKTGWDSPFIPPVSVTETARVVSDPDMPVVWFIRRSGTLTNRVSCRFVRLRLTALPLGNRDMAL
jgi:hypothetical protein